MIMLTTRATGQPDELLFVAPQHVVCVVTARHGDDVVVTLSTGDRIHVADSRDEVVDMVESALGTGV